MPLQTISTLGVLHNHLTSAAISAIQQHLTKTFCSKRLNTIEARARYIAELFRPANDHPIIWQQYTEGNIQNHPEIGGYKMV